MNVLDYSVKLGALLRETDEGKQLFQLENKLRTQYKGNKVFYNYVQLANQLSTQYYFYSWDTAYRTFMEKFSNKQKGNKDINFQTAELISNDREVNLLVAQATSFGELFEKIVATIISGSDNEKIIPPKWSLKITTAISDTKIAVERTLLTTELVRYYQDATNSLDNEATRKYLSERDTKKFLPFSEEASKFMAMAEDVPDTEKILYEELHLLIEAVKKGVYYGFWGGINELNKDDLIDDEGLNSPPLHEISISSKDNDFNDKSGWLYKIQLENNKLYFMAHKRVLSLTNNTSTLFGILYPNNDRGLFRLNVEEEQNQ